MRDLFGDDLVESPDVEYTPSFYSLEEARNIFKSLKIDLNFQESRINIGGKRILIPRLTAWYGDRAYTYSGIRNNVQQFTPLLENIRDRIFEKTKIRFNSVLANFYRNGNDSVAFHADDERELGPEYPNNILIGSLSFGETRKFVLRKNNSGAKFSYSLGNGSFLLMKGRTQVEWKHSIPKTKSPIGERINLTFRIVGENG